MQVGEGDPRSAARARQRCAHLTPTRPPHTHGMSPTRHLHMHAMRSGEHTSAPGTRAGGGTPCRRSARSSADQRPVDAAVRRAGASIISTAQSAHAAPCTPAAIAEKRFACPASRMRRRLSARPCGPQKIDGTVDLVARPPARAPGAHCCTSITAGMSKRASWSACRAARSGSAHRISRANGGSRTASRRPHPRRPRHRVGLAAGAAAFPYGPVCGRVRKREKVTLLQMYTRYRYRGLPYLRMRSLI